MRKRKTLARILRFLVLSLSFSLCVFSFTLNCFAQALSSAELINNAKNYNGQIVVYRGEVIGDVMRRGKFAWVNVNDGKNAIGIWIEFSQTKDIIYTGSYKAKGDVIEVNGIFHRACPEHGGDLDIHAQESLILEKGAPLPERVSRTKKIVTAASLLILGIVWILNLLKRK